MLPWFQKGAQSSKLASASSEVASDPMSVAIEVNNYDEDNNNNRAATTT